VACGDRVFYRITQSSLQAFEIAKELPPPHIRGSRVARQTVDMKLPEPLSVFSPATKTLVVVAAGAVFRYELGDTEAQRYAPIAARGAFFAWSGTRGKSFFVHPHDDASIREYTLAVPASGDRGLPAGEASRVERLRDFDSRLFTVLADGTPLYSTPNGLVMHGQEKPRPLPELSGPVTILFPDSSASRYWAADASGKLGLWDRRQGPAPVLTTSVPGLVIDTAEDGARVAVLSIDLVGHSYRPTVTVFSEGKQQGRLDIGPSFARPEQPELDLCLIRGLPWVVVGGKYWLQLLDWSSRRLLAEW
jgi:hypothetical protein